MSAEKLYFRLEQPHGLGDIYIAWQKGSGNYLATTGYDSCVNIFDRHGQIFTNIQLQGFCAGICWDTDGDLLAIIHENSPQLIIWDSNQNKKQSIDIGLRDSLSCLFWAKTGPIIAIGTSKGNLSLYNHNTSKRTPIIGKHTKRITCGSWNSENLLALGSEDRTLSISNADGDTLRIITLRSEPADIQFSEMKLDERVGGENTVSVIVGKRTLYLYNLLDPENPIELAFQQHYGHIVTYKWFGDGYILLGFSAGFFIAISTHIKEVGQELFQIRNHKNNLTDIALSNSINKVASCGDNTVKIHDISNLQETSSVLALTQETGLDRIAWSEDGQLLAVCTAQGSVNVYLSELPMLTAVNGPKIALLSSLMEVSLFDLFAGKAKHRPRQIVTEIEPNFLALGPYHFAAGMNNRAWFYDLGRIQPGTEKQPVMIRDREYLGAVINIKLNTEYATVLYDGKIHLHMIEQPEVTSEDRESKIFPEAQSSHNLVITCHCITTEFLVYGTDVGHIYYFYIEDWAFATEFRHATGIREIYPDPAGTRLVFIDDKSHGYVYNPVSNEVISIPDLSIVNKVTKVIWDSNLPDRNIFIVYDEQDIITYIYTKQSIYGSSVTKIGKTHLVTQQLPLLLYGGEVTLATSGAQLTQLTLATHDSITQTLSSSIDVNLTKQLMLQRYTEAWKSCQVLNRKECWIYLAEKALENLEIQFAIRVYRHMEDVAMVWALNDISDIEDYKLLCGYVSMYLNDYERAEEWFLKSSKPSAGLDMRRDLLQWDQALSLAKKLDPAQIPSISREYAQQLEFTGNYSEALLHYEKGLSDNSNLDHVTQCKSGVARMSIRCNNYKHGLNLALELNNKQLFKDCAEIFESKKQTQEAAMLFEKAQHYDKAALAYIKLRNWHKVGELIANVTSNKIHLQYAKAKEQEGKFEEAANAYLLGKDFDSVIRLQLEFLNNPEAAVELVQETKSIEGAKLVARFFQRLNDYPSAIRFLVLSRCHDEAFELAKKHGKLPLYGEVLVNSLTPDESRPQDFRNLVMYFENERNFLLAGKYSFHAKDYQKAMKHLIRASKSNSDENEALTIAIDVVASSNDEPLTNQLVEFLLGESDGIPKDPKYLFRLYMARKQYKEAAKTAVIIANEEQINGNYRNAHDVLFSMYQELRRNKIRIPSEMQTNLTLLHSYILVRLHVRRGDHLKGARMLIRVANNISKFPSHIVPILTSAVIECHRAGLKQSAFQFATMLMRPEYRSQVDVKYAKKIEAVVRKPPKSNKDGDSGDLVEPLTPCPYCESKLPETEMTCNQCKNNLPFCIATGRHIINSDLAACPECDFPAIWTEFLNILETEDTCPMCSEKVEPRRLMKIDDIKPYLDTD